MNPVLRVTIQTQADDVGAPGQNQLGITYALVAQFELMGIGINARNRGPGTNFHSQLLGHGLRVGLGQTIRVLVFGKAGRQHRLGIADAVVGSHHNDRGFLIQFAKFPYQ